MGFAFCSSAALTCSLPAHRFNLTLDMTTDASVLFAKDFVASNRTCSTGQAQRNLFDPSLAPDELIIGESKDRPAVLLVRPCRGHGGQCGTVRVEVQYGSTLRLRVSGIRYFVMSTGGTGNVPYRSTTHTVRKLAVIRYGTVRYGVRYAALQKSLTVSAGDRLLGVALSIT